MTPETRAQLPVALLEYVHMNSAGMKPFLCNTIGAKSCLVSHVLNQYSDLLNAVVAVVAIIVKRGWCTEPQASLTAAMRAYDLQHEAYLYMAWL